MSSAIPTASHPRAASRPLPVLRIARFEDYPRIERLEAAHGLLTLPAEHWRSIWLDNPLRARLGENWPIGWVLEEADGRIVGSLANIPTQFQLGGQSLIAATGRGWVVEQDYRAVALWLMDEYFNQDHADLFINTTVNSMAQDPFTAFGSLRVPLGDWTGAAYLVSNYRGFARTALRIKHAPLPALLAWPTAVALRLRDAVTAPHLPAPDPSFTVAALPHFDSGFDAFWHELSATRPHVLLNVRDRATLSWHFAAALRGERAWILTARRAGLMRAYCVVKRQDHPPSGLVRMRMVDYQNLDDSADPLPNLLAVALDMCRRQRIHTLEHVALSLPKMRAFYAAAQYRRPLPAWAYYYHAREAELAEKLRLPDAWDPSAYDGDASL